MTDTLSEIKEILDHVMKTSFISPEEIEEAVNKFKMAYLTLENKEEFLPFLQSYTQDCSDNDEYYDERVSLLKNELDRFYDRIPEMFSLHHVGGYKDPNDKDESERLSKDIDDSFDFMKGNALNQNFLGPEIPENLKPTIIKVLEKISAFHDQKVTNRIELISKWRLLRLAHTTQQIKSQAPALFSIQKFLRKKFNGFYVLRNFAKRSNLEKPKMDAIKQNSNYLLEEEIYKLRNELETYKNNITKNGSIIRVEKTTPNSSLLSIGLEKEVVELNSKLKEKEDIIKSLMDNIKKLSNQNLNELIRDTDSQKDVMKEFKDQINELESRVIALNHENESKDTMLKEQCKNLLETRTTMEKMHNELKKFKLKDHKNLSAYGKVRYLNKILKNFLYSLKNYTFYRLFKRADKMLSSFRNVANRMKARLLIQTRTLNCGQDMRRSFLRWLIKSNPDLLRETFSKIVITSKISHQVAIYRLKKLVFKPMRTKISEAVKAVRRLKAFFLLTELYNYKGLIQKKHFINKLNPNFMSQKESLLNRIMVKKSKQKLKAVKATYFKKLKHKVDVERKTLCRIIDNYNKMRQLGLFALRIKTRHANNLSYLLRMLKGIDQIQVPIQKRNRDFIYRIKTSKRDFIKSTINKLDAKNRSKLAKAVTSLRNQVLEERKKALSQMFEQKMTLSAKKKILEKLSAYKNKRLATALDKFRDLYSSHKLKSLDQNQKIKSVLLKLAQSKEAIQMQTISKLVQNKNGRQQAEDKQKKLLKKLMDAFKTKTRIAFDNLWNQKKIASLNIKERQLNNRRLFTSMTNNYRSKAIDSLHTLTSCLAKSKGLENNKKQIMRKFLLQLVSRASLLQRDVLKNLNKNVSRRAHAETMRDQKFKFLLNSLTAASVLKTKKSIEHLKLVKSASKAKERREAGLRKALLTSLIKNVDRTNQAVLKALVLNKLKRKEKEKHQNRLVKNLLRNLANNYGKLYETFTRLRQENRILSKQEALMISKKRMALLRMFFPSKWKKQSALNQLRGFTSSVCLSEKTGSIKRGYESTLSRRKKNGLLYLMVASMGGKISAAMFKLSKFAKEKKLLDARQRERMHHKLQRFIDGVHKKMDHAFHRLIQNKSRQRILEEDFETQKRKLKNFLGAESQPYDSIKFAALIKQLKVARASGDSDPFFNSIVEDIQKLNNDGRFNELLKKIENGSISNIEQLYEYTSKNNKNGIQDPVLDLINNNRKDIENIVKLTRLLNSDGRYNDLLEKIKANPKMGRADIVTYINTSKNSEKHNDLKRYLDGTKKLDDLVIFMRANNQDGRYDRPLLYLKKCDNPQVTDFLQFLQSNPDSNYNELTNEVNKESFNDPVHKILRFMKNNNFDNRYTEVIAFINKTPNIKLTDAYNFISKNNHDGIFNDLIAFLNDEQIKPAAKFINLLEKENEDGSFDEIIRMFKHKPNVKLTDIYEYIKFGNLDGKYNRAIILFNEPSKYELYNEVIQRKNIDGKYDELLYYVESTKDPKLTDIIKFIKNNNADERYRALREEINKREDVKALIAYLQSDNNPEQYLELFKFVRLNSGSSVFDVYDFIERHNKDRKYDKVLLVMNGSQEKKIFNKVVENMTAHNSDGAYEEIFNELRRIENPQLSHLYDTIVKLNKMGQFDHLIDLINEGHANKAEAIIAFARHNNGDGRYADLLSHFEKIENLKMCDVLDYITKNNSDESLNEIKDLVNELQRPNILNDVLDYMYSNNADGKYNDILAEYRKLPKPTLIDLVKIVRNKNKNNYFSDLLNVINESDKGFYAEDVLKYINNNNQSGSYAEILEFIKLKKNPKISDITAFIQDKNESGKYNDLIEKVNNLYITNDKLHRFVGQNNSNGRYDEFLEYLKLNPNAPLTETLKFILAHNGDGRYEDLLTFINKGGNHRPANPENEADDLFKFFANSRRKTEYPELFEYVDQNTISDPEKLLEYLRNNNSDGRYNELINKISALLQPVARPKSGRTQFNLIKPLKEKLKVCLNKLRENNRFVKDKAKHNKKLLTNIINNMVIRFKMLQHGVISKLIAFKGEYKLNHATKLQKIVKILSLLKKANNSKTSAIMKSLKDINLKENTNVLNKNKSVEKIMLKLRQGSFKKLGSSLYSLRNYNKDTRQKLLKLFAGLVDANTKIKLVVVRMLVDNKSRKQQRGAKLRKAFGQLVFNSRQKLHRSIALLNHNKETISVQNSKKNDKIFKVLSKLKSSNSQILQEAINKLKNHLKHTTAVEQTKFEKSKFLARKLLQGSDNKLSQSLLTFKNNSRALSQHEKLEMKLKKRFLKLLEDSTTEKKENSLRKLVDNKNQATLALMSKDARIKRIIGKAYTAYNAKAGMALQKLNNSTKDSEIKELQYKTKMGKLLKALIAHKKLALKNTLFVLRSCKDKQDQDRWSKFKQLLNKAGMENKLSLCIVINRLKELSNSKSQKQRTMDGKLRKIFNQMSIARQSVMADALNKLIAHKANKKLSLHIQSTLQKKLLSSLIPGTKQYASKCLQTLKENKNEVNKKRLLQKMKLTAVLKKLGQGKTQHCFERLVVHYLKALIAKFKIQRFFERIQTSHQIKKIKTMSKLNNTATVKRLHGQLKAIIFSSLIKKMHSKNRSHAFLEIKERARKQIFDRRNLMKKIKQCIDKKLGYHLRQLKFNNFLYKRNKLNNIISSMILGLRKNHRINLRFALDIWSRKELKNKLQKFSGLLSNLFQKRISYSYYKIKQDYALKKYKKLINGIMNFSNLIEERNMEEKKWAMKTIISQFVDNNPWFRKVIHILAVCTKPNEQIAFWKMRYSKNLKAESLSAEQGLRIKKLDTLLKKHMLSGLSHAYWKIGNASMAAKLELTASMLPR